jgi:hypothetical protein
MSSRIIIKAKLANEGFEGLHPDFTKKKKTLPALLIPHNKKKPTFKDAHMGDQDVLPRAFPSLLFCMQDDASGSQSNETFDKVHSPYCNRPPPSRPPPSTHGC